MRPSEVNFNLIYELVNSIPEYMNITSIELEPTYRIASVSDYNLVRELARKKSSDELQRMIAELDKKYKELDNPKSKRK